MIPDPDSNPESSADPPQPAAPLASSAEWFVAQPHIAPDADTFPLDEAVTIVDSVAIAEFDAM